MDSMHTLSHGLSPFQVWAFDLRGHGDSSIIKGDHTVPLLAEDVLRSIHYHNFQVDLLVGFSLGGKVALELDKMMIETHQKLPSHSYIVDISSMHL